MRYNQRTVAFVPPGRDQIGDKTGRPSPRERIDNNVRGRIFAVNLEKKDVLHVARLAGLALTEEEAVRMTGEISSILGYVEALGKVPVTEGEGESLGAFAPGEDRPLPFEATGEVLSLAPDAGGGFFRVPRILEEGR